MGKYSPKRKNNFFRFLLLFFAFLFLIVCALAFFIWDKLDRITYADEVASSESQAFDFDDDVSFPTESENYVVNIDGLETIETVPLIPEGETSESKDVFNILLIGTDERTTAYNTNARADSMILVSIHKTNHTVRLVSLERGIGVPILEGKYEGQYDLLTHIFRWGGADLLVKTVEHCFKVDVDHYVRLNFAAVKNIVDSIGGIEVEFTEREANYIGMFLDDVASTDSQERLKAGINHIDGGVALYYARLREIDSDWQRVGRQRKVILGVVDALKDSTLLELNDLADTVLPLIQTNLTKLEIAELILYAPNFLTSEFDQMTIPKQGTYGGMKIRNNEGAFAVDYEINNDLLYRFLYEGVSSSELLAE